MRSFAQLACSAAGAAALFAATHALAAQAPTPAAAAPAAKATVPTPPMFTAPEYVMGSPKAKVTLVEYASASCPHCARFDINEFPQLKKKYIDTGKVRYIFREFITPPEQLAGAGFLIARCGGEKNYWNILEQVFRAQEQIYKTGDMKASLLPIAHSVGLSDAQVDACVTDKAAVDALNDRMDNAINKEKINSTPTFIIDGKVFHGDPAKEVDVAMLSAALDPAIAAAR
jgi:protein-disulfide isomerase